MDCGPEDWCIHGNDHGMSCVPMLQWSDVILHQLALCLCGLRRNNLLKRLVSGGWSLIFIKWMVFNHTKNLRPLKSRLEEWKKDELDHVDDDINRRDHSGQFGRMYCLLCWSSWFMIGGWGWNVGFMDHLWKPITLTLNR